MTTPANPPADLVAFIRAQLDEDAAEIAKHPDDDDYEAWDLSAESETNYPCLPYLRIGKKRALAEVDAKRRILDAWEHALKYDGVVKFGGWESCIDMCPEAVLDNVVKLLAAPFAGRPGFREEWKP